MATMDMLPVWSADGGIQWRENAPAVEHANSTVAHKCRPGTGNPKDFGSIADNAISGPKAAPIRAAAGVFGLRRSRYNHTGLLLFD
jgi:hypothetical protein